MPIATRTVGSGSERSASRTSSSPPRKMKQCVCEVARWACSETKPDGVVSMGGFCGKGAYPTQPVRAEPVEAQNPIALSLAKGRAEPVEAQNPIALGLSKGRPDPVEGQAQRERGMVMCAASMREAHPVLSLSMDQPERNVTQSPTAHKPTTPPQYPDKPSRSNRIPPSHSARSARCRTTPHPA